MGPDGHDVEAAYLLGMLRRVRFQLLPEGEDWVDLLAASAWFGRILPWRPDLVPRALFATLADHASAAAETPLDWSEEAVRLQRSTVADDIHIVTRAVGLLTRAVAATVPEANRAWFLSNLCGALRSGTSGSVTWPTLTPRSLPSTRR